MTDWGPGVLGGGLVVGMLVLAGIGGVRRREDHLASIAAMLLAASVPVWAWSIEIVKPDYASAFLTSVGVCAVLANPYRAWTWRRRAILGVVFGVAVLCKPVVAPATIGFALMVCGVRVIARCVQGRRSGLVADVVVLLTVMLMVCGPHLAMAMPTHLRYARETLTGVRADVWRFHGSALGHVLFHVSGPGGRAMIGWGWVWIVPGLCVAAWGLWRRRGRLGRVLVVLWGVVVVTALGVAAVNPMKIMEFGLVFQVCAVIAAAWGVRAVLDRRRARAWRVPVAAVSFALFTWSLLHPTFPLMNATDREAATRQSEVARAVYDACVRATGGTGSVIVAGAPGLVNHNLLDLWAIRDGLAVRSQPMMSLPGDSLLADRLAYARAVVINNGRTGMTEPRRATSGIDEELWRRVREQPDWRCEIVVTLEREGRTDLGVFEVWSPTNDAANDP